MSPEPPPAIAILANDPATMYYGGQDDGELCVGIQGTERELRVQDLSRH